MIATTSFPVERVREQFPSLALLDDGSARIYADNPAGTQVPRRVADAAARCLIENNANLGGFFRTSRAAQGIYDGAHDAMARFLGAQSAGEITIAQSMTTLTFGFSRSIGRTLKAGDELVVTHMDHDANVSPWLALAEDLKLTVRWVKFDPESWVIEPDALAAALNSRTRVVALNFASNLTGSVNDVPALVRIIKEAGALAYVDAVQFAPHGPIDVQSIGADAVLCSSYKFFGPHLGIAWAREELLNELYAYKVRPQPDALPGKFELGTPQIELLAALSATVEYFEWLCAQAGGFEAVVAYETALSAALIDGLTRIAGVRIVGISDPGRYASRVPTISFLHERRTPDEIAAALAKRNIFVWSGHNFALEVVRQLGIDERRGVVRVGLAHYNTRDEVDAIVAAVREICA